MVMPRAAAGAATPGALACYAGAIAYPGAVTMSRLVLLCLVGMSLAGCDEKPSTRKALAGCLMQPNVVLPSGGTDIGLLQICMQTKGYVFDTELSDTCHNDETPQTRSACYASEPWMVGRVKQTGETDAGN